MPGREDPLVGYTFALDVQGTIAGYFTEVAGLGSESEVIEHKVVDQSGRDIVQKLPGRLKWGDITLKRGITSEMDVWTWRAQVEDGKMADARKNASVIMYDRAYTEVARWDFVNAWPSKVSGPSIGADQNSVGIEEMTLVHEGIDRVK